MNYICLVYLLISRAYLFKIGNVEFCLCKLFPMYNNEGKAWSKSIKLY